MPDNNTLIGHITEVSGSRLVATLLTDDEGFQPTIQIGMEEIVVGRLGLQVLIQQKDSQVLAQIVQMWQDDIHVQQGESGKPMQFRRLKLLPLGELDAKGKFLRGVNRFPTVGAEVHVVASGKLDALFEAFESNDLALGALSNKANVKVYLDPNPLFNRHLAIIGQSGAGKSWTVASLLQRTVKSMPNAHIVLLDIHGEYGWRDSFGNLHSAFNKDIVRHVNALDLEIPYWLLTYSELIDLLVDPIDPNASVQIAFMRDVLYNLRKKANTDLDLEQLSVDSPIYFSLKEMYLHFKRANEQMLDFGKSKGTLFGAFDEFLVRFQSMYNDSRYDFLLRPKKRTKSAHLENLLRDFVGLGEPKRQITVVDLSPVPADVRPIVAAQIGRLAFEFNYWNPQRREFPILLVCEEAHQYLPRGENVSYRGALKSMERIAKEGRKYGVGLCVVSQRPTELSETVLSQCSSYICLRISNPDDQEYIRGLMPEGEADLADVLSSLRRGEALVLGEAAPLPTRMQIFPPVPPPASNDAPLSESWRSGPDDLDVANIVRHWWEQKR